MSSLALPRVQRCALRGRPSGHMRLFAFVVEQSRLRDRLYFCSDATAAAALGVSRFTIINWKKRLLEEGLIVRVGKVRFGRLRPTIAFRVVKGVLRLPRQRISSTQRTTCRSTERLQVSYQGSRLLKQRSLIAHLPLARQKRKGLVMRNRDEAWEALVEVTDANPAVERGVLNKALAAIREAATYEGLHPDSLPQEIRLRADSYRLAFPGCTLTPMALAKHWRRVFKEARLRGMSREELMLEQMRKRVPDDA